MSTRYPQFTALLFGGGGLAASLAWAFAALPGWAVAILALLIATSFATPVFALGAVTWVGLSAESVGRRKSAERIFELLLEFFRIVLRSPGS
jgi:hypothetical protein